MTALPVELLSWADGAGPDLACPNCGSAGPTRLRLRCSGPPQRPAPGFALLGCATCGCSFFHPMPEPDYAATPAGRDAALSFYLQQGAGLWSIASTLLGLDLPGPRRLLEIGCGFGFGLDVARRALGWEVRGFDPSPFAALGAEELGLPITHDYFRPGTAAAGTEDVVLCSEVIEHLERPLDFLREMRAALRPGGVLVLTTPNAEAVRPETPPGLLVPLLSVGYHTVLQSARSLEHVLRGAGFATIEIEDRGASLLARASDGPAAWHAPGAADRARYRAWLESAEAALPAGASDLRIGLLGRAYREAVAAGEAEAADRLLGPLDAACGARFGLSLAEATPIAELPGDLAALARRMPLSWGALLLQRGLHRLLRGEPRPPLEPLFRAAAGAAAALRTALQAIGSDDGDAEDVVWVAGAEAVLCAAARGAGDVAGQLAALGPAPGVGAAAGRADTIRRRVFTELVNAGHYVAAAPLADVAAPALLRAEGGTIPLADDELSALFCAGVLEANTPTGAPMAGLRLARGLRMACLRGLAAGQGGSASVLLWPSVEIELLLLRRLNRASEVALLQQSVADIAARPNVPPPPRHLQTAQA